MTWTQEDIDADQGLDCCPECHGEGVVYDCLDEIGCLDPEGGCGLCARRCDYCGPAVCSEREGRGSERQRADAEAEGGPVRACEAGK